MIFMLHSQNNNVHIGEHKTLNNLIALFLNIPTVTKRVLSLAKDVFHGLHHTIL